MIVLGPYVLQVAWRLRCFPQPRDVKITARSTILFLTIRRYPGCYPLQVTWECTLRHSLQWPWVEEWLEGEGRRAEFMEGAA